MNRHWCMKNNERIEKANLKQKIKVKERKVYNDKDIIEVELKSVNEKIIKEWRPMLVILGRQVDFSNVEVKQIKVPIYGKVKDKKQLQQDM